MRQWLVTYKDPLTGDFHVALCDAEMAEDAIDHVRFAMSPTDIEIWAIHRI